MCILCQTEPPPPTPRQQTATRPAHLQLLRVDGLQVLRAQLCRVDKELARGCDEGGAAPRGCRLRRQLLWHGAARHHVPAHRRKLGHRAGLLRPHPRRAGHLRVGRLLRDRAPAPLAAAGALALRHLRRLLVTVAENFIAAAAVLLANASTGGWTKRPGQAGAGASAGAGAPSSLHQIMAKRK